MFLSLDPKSKAFPMFTTVRFATVRENDVSDAPGSSERIEDTGMVWARWSEPRHFEGKTIFVILYDIRPLKGGIVQRVPHKACQLIQEAPQADYEHIQDTACARVTFTDANGQTYNDLLGTKRPEPFVIPRRRTIKPWLTEAGEPRAS